MSCYNDKDGEYRCKIPEPRTYTEPGPIFGKTDLVILGCTTIPGLGLLVGIVWLIWGLINEEPVQYLH